MSHGYTYNQEEWDAVVHEAAVPAKGKRNRRKEFLWAFRGALIVSLAAICIWFFAYGGNNSVAGIYSSGSASSTTDIAEEILSSEEASTVISSEESSVEEEVSATDRCDPEYWPGGFRNPTIMYCDGAWMRVGEKQTDDLVVYQWASGAWQEYEPHGETFTGFDCYDSSQMESDGVSPELREKLTACDSGESEIDVNSAGGKCGELTGQEAFSRWVNKVPDSGFGEPWIPAFKKDTYDPCADLSYIVITVEAASTAAPHHIMLFNKGEYLGTATYYSYAFAPLVTRDSDSAITVEYKYLRTGEANVEASGRTTAHFRWDDGQEKVIMTGSAPPCNTTC